MRPAILCFAGIVSCLLLASAQTPRRPIPPGLREAQKAEQQPLEPPLEPQRRVAAPVTLKRQADEFAKLAATIPAQIDQVVQGKLPKNLQDDLKRLEKLARKLRSEVSPN